MHLASKEMALLLFSDPTEAWQSLDAIASLRLAEDTEEDPGDDRPLAAPSAPARDRGEILLHLLTCPRCRRRVAEVLLSPTAGGTEDLKVRLLDLASGLQADAAHHLDAERTAAQPLFQDLLRIPAAERLNAIHQGAPGFCDVSVAELLARAAEEAMAKDLDEARHLAFLATAILEGLPQTPRQCRLLAVAYCTVADVERRRGILDGADELLANAVLQLAGDPLLHRARARLCLSLGRLRREQGRVDEALALFERARRIAEELGADDEQASASLAAGWLLLEEFESDDAFEPLWEAYRLLEGRRLEEVLSAVHALLLAHYAAGNTEAVPELLTVLERLRDLLPAPLGEIRATRILAQVDSVRGEHIRAQLGFEAVFRRLASEGLAVEAAAAALELVRNALEKGGSSNRDVLESVLRQLAGLEIPPHVAEVVTFAISFALRSPSGGYFLEALVSAEIWLQRAQFNPALPYFPLAEPELLVSWNQISMTRRRLLAETAGVELRSIREGRHERWEPVSLAGRHLIAWTHEALTGQRIVFPNGRHQDDDTKVDSPGAPA